MWHVQGHQDLNEAEAVWHATELCRCLAKLCHARRVKSAVILDDGAYNVCTHMWMIYGSFGPFVWSYKCINKPYHIVLDYLETVVAVEKTQILELICEILPQPIAEELCDHVSMIGSVLAAFGVSFFI